MARVRVRVKVKGQDTGPVRCGGAAFRKKRRSKGAMWPFSRQNETFRTPPGKRLHQRSDSEIRSGVIA